MEHPYRSLIVGVLMLVATGTTAAEAPASPQPATVTQSRPETTQPLVIMGATRLEGEMVRWAMRRFESARLELPPVEILFHDGTDGCGGFLGYYAAADGRVDICNRGGRSTAPINTVLHELGHAWSFANMTEADIAGFVTDRKLDVWHDDTKPWWQRGQEQAAEVVAWGLQDAIEYRSIWLHLEACSDLATDFESITGIPPLHNNTTYCG